MLYDDVTEFNSDDTSKRRRFEKWAWYGDRVLNFALTKMIFNHENAEEMKIEHLNLILKELQNNKRLVQKAHQLKLYKMISGVEELDEDDLAEMLEDYEKTKEFADFFEAFVGVLTEDVGVEKAAHFVHSSFKDDFERLLTIPLHRLKDPKGLLQELGDAGLIKFNFSEPKKIAKRWKVELTVRANENVQSFKGFGKNKKEAEEKAAFESLEWLLELNDAKISEFIYENY